MSRAAYIPDVFDSGTFILSQGAGGAELNFYHELMGARNICEFWYPSFHSVRTMQKSGAIATGGKPTDLNGLTSVDESGVVLYEHNDLPNALRFASGVFVDDLNMTDIVIFKVVGGVAQDYDEAYISHNGSTYAQGFRLVAVAGEYSLIGTLARASGGPSNTIDFRESNLSDGFHVLAYTSEIVGGQWRSRLWLDGAQVGMTEQVDSGSGMFSTISASNYRKFTGTTWAKPALFARCRGFVPAEDQLAVLNGFKAEHGIA